MAKPIWHYVIKNADDVQNPQVRLQYGTLAGVFGIVCNVILFGIKLLAGTVSNSIAILADAFNNLSDAGSSLVTVVGFKMSGKPADREHPFGHGRIEYISGLIVSFVILLVGFELFTSSVDKIRTPGELQTGILSVIILSFSIVVKLGMGIVYRLIGKKIQSPSLLASMTDSLSDVAATGAVLVSVGIALLFHIDLDGWIGALVAVFVFVAGLRTLKSTMGPLLGQAPDPELVDEIREKVLAYEGILGVHDMMVHNYGPNRFLASLHAEVSASGDLRTSHDLIDRVEREVGDTMGIRLVIHMDPIETENERVSELREMTQRVLTSIDPALSIHDFRIVDGPSHTNLIYDVLVPFSVKVKGDELRRRIQEETQKVDPRCFTVITIDTSFTGEE